MKVVESDKLKAWIDANSFESTTPVPPTPEPPPTPPPIPPPGPGIGTQLSWNATTGFISIGSGQTQDFYFTNLGTNYKTMEILVFGESLSTHVVCILTFPDGAVRTETIGYEMSTSAWNFRAKAYIVQPNLPYQYIPSGTYTLRILANANSVIRIRTRIS